MKVTKWFLASALVFGGRVLAQQSSSTPPSKTPSQGAVNEVLAQYDFTIAFLQTAVREHWTRSTLKGKYVHSSDDKTQRISGCAVLLLSAVGKSAWDEREPFPIALKKTLGICVAQRNLLRSQQEQQ